MIQDAKSQGIALQNGIITSFGWNVVTSPILHDRSNNNVYRPSNPPVYDRQFIYGNGTSVNQTAAVIGGTSWTWSRNFVSYYAKTCGTTGNKAVGQVDMAKYSAWLATLGVNVGYGKSSSTSLCS